MVVRARSGPGPW